MKTLLLLILLHSSAFAASSAPVIHVQPLDPSFDASKLAGPGIQIDPLPPSARVSEALPPPKVMDRVFAKAKLTELVASMDQLDRDLLYHRAASEPPAKLRNEYPAIPSSKLSALAKLVKGAP